jgi:hypothetical protein
MPCYQYSSVFENAVEHQLQWQVARSHAHTFVVQSRYACPSLSSFHDDSSMELLPITVEDINVSYWIIALLRSSTNKSN